MAATRYGRLGCLMLALTAVIGWELHEPAEAFVPAGVPRAILVNGPAQQEPAAAERKERAAAALSRMLQRPLFHADRRPAVIARATEPAGDSPLPRLAGIIVTASTRTAIFAGSATSKAVAVAEGGSLGPVQVTKIEAGEVTVRGAGSVRVLRPALQAAIERAPSVAVRQASNTVTTTGATFGAVPAERLALLRNNAAASLLKLRTTP